MAVDLFRHFLGANGAHADASDVARAVAFTISGLEESASGPLDVLYARSGIPGYPAITVGLAEPPEVPEEPEPPPPRCG